MRRLKLQQSCSLQSGQLSRYSGGSFNSPLSHNLNFSGLQQVTITSPKDPLGLAERGKVGIPPSSSECSSNSSVEASIESNTGLINGEKKGNEVFPRNYFFLIE